MHPVVKASLVLAAAVAVLSVLIYVTGLHQSFMLGQSVFLATAIAVNAAVVIWALSKTATTSGYLQQVGHAAGIGLLGGGLVVLVSWSLLAIVFPDVLAETRAAAVASMEQAGTPTAELERQLETLDAATPLGQAVQGGIGTFFTSLFCGAVFAFWKRRR